MNNTNNLASAGIMRTGRRRQRPPFSRLLLGIASVLAALWFVGHDAAAWVLRPAVILVKRYVYVDGWRRLLTRFGPYTTLLLLSVPLIVVEPAKLIALYVIGRRHYVAGTIILILVYAVGLLIIDRVFELNKKKLLTIRWLARLYAIWERFHRQLYADIRTTPTWRNARWVWLSLRRRRLRMKRRANR